MNTIKKKTDHKWYKICIGYVSRLATRCFTVAAAADLRGVRWVELCSCSSNRSSRNLWTICGQNDKYKNIFSVVREANLSQCFSNTVLPIPTHTFSKVDLIRKQKSFFFFLTVHSLMPSDVLYAALLIAYPFRWIAST